MCKSLNINDGRLGRLLLQGRLRFFTYFDLTLILYFSCLEVSLFDDGRLGRLRPQGRLLLRVLVVHVVPHPHKLLLAPAAASAVSESPAQLRSDRQWPGAPRDRLQFHHSFKKIPLFKCLMRAVVLNHNGRHLELVNNWVLLIGNLTIRLT